jgi:TolB-like protein/class 3 adenylate cyclase
LERRLAAILAADVVGYTRLMRADEVGTLERLTELREAHLEPIIAEHRGRIVKLMGDGLLVEFASVVDALNCAIAWQEGVVAHQAGREDEKRLNFRIGINLGDVIVEGKDIHGDGVNIAARLEGLAEPGGICLSDDAYRQVRGKTEASFEDLGEQDLKNVVEPLRVYRISSVSDDRAGDDAAREHLVPPDKPSIAVLPFVNVSGDPEQEYFADGITEDIITALSRYRGLLVTSRYSAFAYKGQSSDVRRVATELEVGYVIEGSVRRAGNRVRIAGQLIDGISGKHIWAERYDRELKDVFALQDEITETIVARIEPEVGAFESQRAKQRPPGSLDAWDYYHLGLAGLYKFTADDNAEAQRLFQHSFEIDPGFAAAHAWFAYAIILGMVYFDTEPETAILDAALHAAEKGVTLDSQDALAHFTLGRVHLVRGEYDLAVAELETSIELNPCLAQSHCGLGDALAYDGRLRDSILHFEEAVRLSPKDPYRWGFYGYRSLAHLFLKEHEAAAEWASRAARIPNAPSWAKAHLVAALGHLDRTAEAEAAVRDLLRQKPDYSIGFARRHLFFVKDTAQLDHYLDGLRKAGLPE